MNKMIYDKKLKKSMKHATRNSLTYGKIFREHRELIKA